MVKFTIYEDTCKGCGLCVTACPKKILQLRKNKVNAKGYLPVEITDEKECIACISCARICPDMAIEIDKD